MILGIILIVISTLLFCLDIFLIVKWVNRKEYETWELYLHGILLALFGALSIGLIVLGASLI